MAEEFRDETIEDSENEQKIKAVADLIASKNFNEPQYIKNRLEKKIKKYTDKKLLENPKTSKYNFDESDFDNVVESFIFDKTKEKIFMDYLEISFNNLKGRDYLKGQISAVLSNKKLFRNLWRENHVELKGAFLDIFKFKKEKSLNKLQIANLFINNPIVKNIDENNDFFISSVLTTNDWNIETLADKRLIDLRNNIKSDMRDKEKSEGYIVLENIEMLKNQVVDGEKTMPSAWKYTEDWKQIRKYCAASAIQGAARVLGNLSFLAKNNQIDDIESQINDIWRVVQKLEKEIKNE